MALCDLHLLLSDVYIWIYCLFPAYLLRGIPGWQMQCQGHYMNKNLPCIAGMPSQSYWWQLLSSSLDHC